MSFNPVKHHRKSIRLQEYGYAQPGFYFITICTQNRAYLFGEILNGHLQASTVGRIAHEQWRALPTRWPSITIDAFVVMPNHIHGILHFKTPTPKWAPASPPPSTPVGAPLAGAQNPSAPIQERMAADTGATARVAPTVGAVVGCYKSLVFNACLALSKQQSQHLGPLWQRNYWERVVRDETELHHIREYIQNNSAQWEMDALYVKGGV